MSPTAKVFADGLELGRVVHWIQNAAHLENAQDTRRWVLYLFPPTFSSGHGLDPAPSMCAQSREHPKSERGWLHFYLYTENEPR